MFVKPLMQEQPRAAKPCPDYVSRSYPRLRAPQTAEHSAGEVTHSASSVSPCGHDAGHLQVLLYVARMLEGFCCGGQQCEGVLSLQKSKCCSELEWRAVRVNAYP